MTTGVRGGGATGRPWFPWLRRLVLWAGRPLVLAVLREEADRAEQVPTVFGPADRVHVFTQERLHRAIVNTMSGHVTIGPRSFLGHRVMLLTGTHDWHATGEERVKAIPDSGRDIVIGTGVWIASGAIVLGPCRIGDDAVVAAGSVVTCDVPAGAVVAGAPARVVAQVSAPAQ